MCYSNEDVWKEIKDHHWYYVGDENYSQEELELKGIRFFVFMMMENPNRRWKIGTYIIPMKKYDARVYLQHEGYKKGDSRGYTPTRISTLHFPFKPTSSICICSKETVKKITKVIDVQYIVRLINKSDEFLSMTNRTSLAKEVKSYLLGVSEGLILANKSLEEFEIK